MPEKTINWVKNTNTGQSYDLLRLNLESPYFTDKVGVYVIWYASPSEAKVIRVGQGGIGDRLREHRNNWQITQYSKYGQLKATWAIVDKQYLGGVEVFLFDYYKPLIGERSPATRPISVNPI